MNDKWLDTTIGAVALVVGGGTPRTSVAEFWGGDIPWVTPTEVTAQEGGTIFKTERSITQLGLDKSGARLLPIGSVLLTSRATIGAVALAGCALATNQGFASLIASERLLPKFLLYWCQANTPEFVARAGGNTFLEISKAKVATIPMLLPPLDEQHRIVDILEQADQVIDSASSEVAALHTLLESSLRGEAITARGSTSTIAGLCLAIIGGIWGLPPGQAEIDVYALGPRIFSQGSPYFSTVGSPKRSVTDGQLESRLVQVDDIILERSGGGPDQPVGRVVYAPRDLEPCIPTDFMRLLRCNPELVEPRYLYWRLRGDYLAGETRSFQRQTTGINNLSVPAYLARQIEVPDRTAQTSLVGCWDSMAAAIVAASTARDAHKQLRTALLNDLISGEHRIGREYDDLLEAP